MADRTRLCLLKVEVCGVIVVVVLVCPRHRARLPQTPWKYGQAG